MTMFRTIWSKTLRDFRLPVLGWGLGMGLLILAVYATWGQTESGAAQESITQLARSFRFFGDPVAVDTPDGFVTWRSFALVLPVMVSIWALLAGARLVRGEEERGAMDILLSTPNHRVRLLLEKLGALVIALVFIGLLIGLGAALGQSIAEVEVRPGAALLAGLNVSLFAFFMATLALFLSQFFRDRGVAAGWTGGILALSVLLDGTGRSIEDGEWIQLFSPLSYYSVNKPMIANHESNPGAALVLLGGALLLTIVSALLFTHRDIGGTALNWTGRAATAEQNDRRIQRALHHAERDLSVRGIGLRAIRAQVTSALWWLLALAAYTGWLTAFIPTLLEPLRNLFQGNPALGAVFSIENEETSASLLGMIIFQFVPVIIVIFTLTQATRWSADLDSGRLELILSLPISRFRLLLERFIAVLFFAVTAPLLIWGTLLVVTQLVGIKVDSEKIAAATLGILPLELIIATFVYAVAARLRSGSIIGITTLYLVGAFLVQLLGGALGLPDWLKALSIFNAYGNPILNGWNWGSWAILLGIAALFLVVGLVQFRLADIDRGS
jgi:ABC-2 type transport system permease protein